MAVLDRAAALAGVRSVSLMSDRSMTGRIRMAMVAILGYTPQRARTSITCGSSSEFRGPAFPSTAGMQLIAGRDFADPDSTCLVAIVNQSFAK